MTLRQWAKKLGVTYSALLARMRRGLPIEQAVSDTFHRPIPKALPLTHTWEGIKVSKYVYNVMSREVCADYAKQLKGSARFRLSKTLTKCRWFTAEDVARFTELPEDAILNLLRTHRDD
jgi:hypothetical protein